MSKKIANKPLSEKDKQIQPMPGEIDPKNVKIGVFLAMQRTKYKLKIKK